MRHCYWMPRMIRMIGFEGENLPAALAPKVGCEPTTYWLRIKSNTASPSPFSCSLVIIV